MILKAAEKLGRDDQFPEQLGFMRKIKKEMKAMRIFYPFLT